MTSRIVRTLMIVLLLTATARAGTTAEASLVTTRPMTTTEMTAAEGALSWGECFLLGVSIGIVCGSSGGLACAAALIGAAGGGGLDCL